MYDINRRTQMHWPPLYNMNVYERTVVDCVNSRYCIDRSGAEQNVGHWNKLHGRRCSCAAIIHDLRFLPWNTFQFCIEAMSKKNQQIIGIQSVKRVTVLEIGKEWLQTLCTLLSVLFYRYSCPSQGCQCSGVTSYTYLLYFRTENMESPESTQRLVAFQWNAQLCL